MKKNASRFVRLLGIAACITLPVLITQQKSDSSSNGISRINAQDRARLLRADAHAVGKHRSYSGHLLISDRGTLKQTGFPPRLSNSASYSPQAGRLNGAGSAGFANGLPEGTVLVRGVPVHPSRVMVRVREGVSIKALKAGLETVGASVDADPNPAGWAAVNLDEVSAEIQEGQG